MKIPRSFSFKSKALFVLGGLQLLGLLVLGFLAYEQSQSALKELSEDKLQLAMEGVSKDLSDYVRDESRLAIMLAKMLPLQSILDASENSQVDPESQLLYEMGTSQLEQTLVSTASMHPGCLELSLLDHQGQEVVRVRVDDRKIAPVPNYSLRNRSTSHYFRGTAGLSAGQVYVSPLLHERDWESGNTSFPPTFWVAAPIPDEQGRPRGVLALHLDPGERLARIRSPLEQGRAFLVDQGGALLYHSTQATGAASIPPQLSGIHPRLADILAADKSQDVYVNCEQETMPSDEHHDALCMHGYGKIHYDPLNQESYWAVVFDAPPAVIFAPSNELRNRFIRWGSLVIGLSLVLTFALSHRMVVRPILHLGKIAERVAGGDLHPEIAPYKRDDEIGQLYGSFDIMLHQLRAATEHLQEQIQARTTKLEISEARLERQNQELERLNSYKSHLLSVVSHELKTPLASLDGFSRIINQIFLTDRFVEQFDSAQQEKLQQVRHRIDIMGKNTARLIRLVDELLDFSRIDRGRGLEMNKERIDLGKILLEAVESHAELAAKKGLAVSYVGSLQPEGLWALADADRLAQIFNNLLNNAIKFTDSGEDVRVEARYLEDYLEFRVYDDGEGIEAEALERIFELFEQAGDTVSRKQGTGIGLAISKYIVEQHGGYIRAESAGPGQGSCFIFALPRPQDDPALHQTADQPHQFHSER